jgi:hypothetical protein
MFFPQGMGYQTISIVVEESAYRPIKALPGGVSAPALNADGSISTSPR